MQELHDWFLENRREFPWRVNPTPYRVWVSEVMLQQTRASVVVPYFQRWIDLFPDVKALAGAPIDLVIKCWEGLGYYSRVRNLHGAAQQILAEFNGEIPSTSEELKRLKGLGPYTIGAILSFGFHQKAAAVDGNVLRVISRLDGLEENVCRTPVRRKIELLTTTLLDDKAPWITMEALIELGATTCTPAPRCEDCPLKGKCVGFKTGKAIYLPIKNAAVKTTHLERIVTVLLSNGKVLLKKGEAGKVMADLYEFPYHEKKDSPFWSKGKAISLTDVEHTFTRFKARLSPRLYEIKETPLIEGYCWIELEKLSELPFSSGHRKIVQELCRSYT